MRAVIALPLVWLGIFFLLPFVLVLAIALGTNAPDSVPPVALGLSFANFKLLFTDDLYLAAWLISLRIAATSTLVALLLGYPMAYAIARAAPARRPLLLMLVVLPFWTSVLIRIYAWMGLLARNGLLDQFLRWTGLAENPGTIIGTEWAIHLGIVYAYLPFMVLPLYAGLERLDRSLIEAALDLGASQARAFLTVVVPLAMPGIISGVILVFIPALGSYLIPDLLGGTDSQMIANVIERQSKGANDWPFGAALSFLLMYVTFGALALRAYLMHRRPAGGRP